jgi:hypothetical protein
VPATDFLLIKMGSADSSRNGPAEDEPPPPRWIAVDALRLALGGECEDFWVPFRYELTAFVVGSNWVTVVSATSPARSRAGA